MSHSSPPSDVQAALALPQSYQRKAAYVQGAGIDHTGKVVMEAIQNFDLNRTIFSTLKGAFPRMVVRAKIAKKVYWDEIAAGKIEQAYQEAREESPSPPIDPKILTFMNEECDFAVEHADGSFLEHLLFCYDYGVRHFPDYSANVLLLHSILGTGTNTFAMTADKIPALRELLTEFEMLHIEAFPSVLRLLYHLKILDELNANSSRLSELESITFHRVIDNKELTMSAEDLWIQLNYQLIHLVDFLPVANWVHHSADPLFQNAINLYAFLSGADKLMANVTLDTPNGPNVSTGEPRTFGGWVSSVIPAGKKQAIAAKAIEKYSATIEHSLAYRLSWKSA